MAVKPLTLKRQRGVTSTKARTFEFSAEVCIEGLPFHLPETYSYGIPNELGSLVQIGSKVRVPFRNDICDGFVLSISTSNQSPVKPIDTVGKEKIEPQLIDSARAIAERYICRLSDILRMIDPVSVGESSNSKNSPQKSLSFKSLRGDWIGEESERITSYKSLLIIFPTNRDLERLAERLTTAGIAYRDLRKKSSGPDLGGVFLGLRSAIFAQINNLEAIWIVDENSEHHWERRSPKWNTRDVALIRYQNEDFELRFLSVCPSLELWRLYEIGYIKNERGSSRRRPDRRIFFNNDSIHKAIRFGLEKGSVLVTVAGKDYVKAFACSKCSSAPRCECGGVLLPTPKSLLKCTICKESKSWKCLECGSTKYNLIGKGAQRLKEEFRKSFPNIPIYSSTSEREILKVPERSIVIATSGMEPIGKIGGIISLDTLFLQNIPELRAEERLRAQLFTLLNNLVEGGVFFLNLPANNRLSKAISLDSPENSYFSELAERSEARLPPNWRIVRIECEGVSSAISGLVSEHPNVLVSYESSRVAMLRTEVSQTGQLVKSIKLLQIYRSLSRKPLLKLEIDPYKL